MTAPTQELPAWLSYTTITLPRTTETTLVYLPLTYYGPSIPLGTDWTYGGLTSPAPTTTATTRPPTTPTTSSISSTSVTPTSTITSSIPSSPSLFSSPALPSSTSPIAPSTSIPLSASSTSTIIPPSSTSASPSNGDSTSHLSLNRGQLAGIIIGGILSLMVIVLLAIWLCARFRREEDKDEHKFTSLVQRRRRKPRPRTRFTMVTPATGSMDEYDVDWLMVPSPTSPRQRTEPGQGATEADPFLTSLPNPHPSPPTDVNRNSASSRGTGFSSTSSGTNISGYGDVLAHPSLSFTPQEDGANPFDAPPGQLQPIVPAETNAITSRRILSPSQLAVLTEEEVLPRGSEDSEPELGDEVGQVVIARRVAVSPRAATAELTDSGVKGKERRRSWIPRFSWNRDERTRDAEEGGLLLFDAGRHSPSNSLSPLSSPSPIGAPPKLVTVPKNEMREFGSRSVLPLLGGAVIPRPLAGSAAASRPVSGLSGMSSDGTTGSAKSGGTVYTDALETLSSRDRSIRSPSTPAAENLDPLDVPAPPALAEFTSSSQHSLSSSSDPTSDPASSLTERQSHTTMATTPATGNSPMRQRAYAHGPPGLEDHGSISSWDKFEHGFSRPPSHDQLGTFGSSNLTVVPLPASAFGGGVRLVHPTLDDAPPGANGSWRQLGGVQSNAGPGHRFTFGESRVAKYHDTQGPPSEHGSFHSRLNLSLSSGSSVVGLSDTLPARSRALQRSDSVQGSLSPPLSAFGSRSRSRDPQDSLPRSRSPGSSLLVPWVGGLDSDWRPA